MTALQPVNEAMIDSLNKQLSELDLLKSMYPRQNELILSDSGVLEDIKNYVENKTFHMPNHLDFVLKLQIEELKLEIYINLPSLYPAEEEPDVYVRCNQFNRYQETSLNSELSQYIKTIYDYEVCLYTVILWLQENVDNFKIKTEVVPKIQPVSKMKTPTFTRLWIFSHHIYSKYKRDKIIDLCKELNLTGFCCPGKPGIICIEGTDEDCTKWWKDIKTMNWKRICIRKTEIFDIKEKDSEQKFKDFQEVDSHTTKNGFSKYIEKHNLSQEFCEFLKL